jgi:hypothetical protein
VQKVLAEPFPGTVAQGVSLLKVRDMNELSLGQNQMPMQIKVLGERGERLWVASIFAAVESDPSLVPLIGNSTDSFLRLLEG